MFQIFQKRKQNIFLIIFIVLLTLTSESYSHNKIIKGVVMNKNGKSVPVVGATVRLEGTVLGTVTNREGKFVIKKIPDGKYTLVITSVGMHTVRKDLELMHIEGDELELNIEMEESSINMSTLVITATRSEKIYEDVPLKVSTANENDFKIACSNSLRESLQFQPGIRTEVNCQNCGFSQVRINGLEGKYSQVLIDGKAIFSSLNGVYGLDQIPTNMIDRIEVVRGGGSSLYGGNAIAGVINIITKEPNYNYFYIRWDNLLIKNKFPENVLNINGTIVNDNQNLGMSIFGTLNSRHEYDANDDGFTEIGRLDLKTFGGKLFWKLSSQSKITTEFHAVHHEIRGGNLLDLPPHQTDITENAKNETILGQVSLDQYIGDGNKLNIFLSGQNTNRNSYYGANKNINAYGNTNNQTFALGASYSHFMDNFIGNHILLIGYDFNFDEMQDNAPAYNRYINQKIYTNGLFIQDDWSISDHLFLLFGVRIDKHNLIENPVFNPRASLLYKTFSDLSLRVTYSTGYRAPQAFDEDLHITQVSGEGIVILMDKNLKPEYSHSISASLDYSFDMFTLPFAASLEYFYTNLRDVFILEDNGLDTLGNRVLTRKNGESANVNGITFEVQSNIINGFTLKLGVTYQTSLYSKEVEWSAGEDGGTPQLSDKIFKTPDLYGYLLASINIISDLKLDLSANFTGPMYIPHYKGYIEKDILHKTQSFIDASFKLSYLIIKNPNIELNIGLQNIFDAYQQDFDKGIDRDAGYIYGPFRPRTMNFAIRISN